MLALQVSELGHLERSLPDHEKTAVIAVTSFVRRNHEYVRCCHSIIVVGHCREASMRARPRLLWRDNDPEQHERQITDDPDEKVVGAYLRKLDGHLNSNYRR